MKVLYQKDEEVLSKQEALDGIVISTNQAKAELQDAITQKKQIEKDIAELEDKLATAKSDFEKSVAELEEKKQSFIANTESESEKYTSAKAETDSVLAELQSLKELFESKKASLEDDIKEHEKSCSVTLKQIQSDIASSSEKLESLKSEIESTLVLHNDVISEYEKMKDFVANADSKVKELQAQEETLKVSLENNTRASFAATQLAEQKKQEYDDMVAKMEQLNHDLTNTQIKRDEMINEMSIYASEREGLSREKLLFQNEKSEILMKEQFIREKYELAGVPYK